MTTRDWPRVLAVVTMASVIGCAQDRHAATNPEAASSVVAPDKTQPDPVGPAVMMRAVEQHYPNLDAQTDRVPVLWFVADAKNQVLATHRNDAISPSGSLDEVRRQFPNVDLSHLADVRVLYHGDTTGKAMPATIVWARADANIVQTPNPMRVTIANLVAHYYGTTAPTGQLRKLWFQASAASGAIIAHGEGYNSTLAGSSGFSFIYAPGELLQDSVRAVWIGQ